MFSILVLGVLFIGLLATIYKLLGKLGIHEKIERHLIKEENKNSNTKKENK